MSETKLTAELLDVWEGWANADCLPKNCVLSLIAAARELKARWTRGDISPGHDSIGDSFLCYLELNVNSVPVVLEYAGDGVFVDPEEEETPLLVTHWMPLPKGPAK